MALPSANAIYIAPENAAGTEFFTFFRWVPCIPWLNSTRFNRGAWPRWVPHPFRPAAILVIPSVQMA